MNLEKKYDQATKAKKEDTEAYAKRLKNIQNEAKNKAFYKMMKKNSRGG